MVSIKSVYRLTIAYKFLMAISGLILVGFLVMHVLGNLLVFTGTDAINQYAIKLREYPLLLWTARGVLILAALSHIFAGIKLSLLNKGARPVSYQKAQSRKASLASRTMVLSGFVVLGFVLYHLAHFTFKWTHRDLFAYLEEHDVYSMLMLSFKSLPVTAFYVLSIILLMLHLSHGVSSFFQTLGINHSKYNTLIKALGPILSVLLAFGFLIIPLSIFFRLIQ